MNQLGSSASCSKSDLAASQEAGIPPRAPRRASRPAQERQEAKVLDHPAAKTTVGCCSSQVLKRELETSALPSTACSSQTVASQGPTLPTPNPMMPEVTTLHLPYTHSQLSAPVGLRLPTNKKPRKGEVPLARRSVGPGLSTTQHLLYTRGPWTRPAQCEKQVPPGVSEAKKLPCVHSQPCPSLLIRAASPDSIHLWPNNSIRCSSKNRDPVALKIPIPGFAA